MILQSRSVSCINLSSSGKCYVVESSTFYGKKILTDGYIIYYIIYDAAPFNDLFLVIFSLLISRANGCYYINGTFLSHP